jgi:hypothetical protein
MGEVKRNRAFAPLALAVALMAPAGASADYTATLDGSHAAFAGDGQGDILTIELSPPSLLGHNRFFQGDSGFVG